MRIPRRVFHFLYELVWHLTGLALTVGLATGVMAVCALLVRLGRALLRP